MKWQGWGYKDSQFFLNPNGLIQFSGSRYHLSGHVLPRLKDWMLNKLQASIDNYSPGIQQPPPDMVPNPIFHDGFINEFQTVFGSTIHYSADMHDRLFHGHGHTLEEIWKLRNGEKFERVPDWVVWPRTHQDVEKIVHLATKHNVCLIPFGGGTSVTWALLCPANENRMIVSVDTSQMNKILYIDEKNLTARIQSGIIGQDLERELGKKGLILSY